MRHAIAIGFCLIGLTACGIVESKPSSFTFLLPANSADLTPNARSVVRQAASEAVGLRRSNVTVNTGTTATPLADRRFLAIQKAWVEGGASAAVLNHTPAVTVQPAEAGQDRVEITLHPNTQ
jgi:hypothetical protein